MKNLQPLTPTLVATAALALSLGLAACSDKKADEAKAATSTSTSTSTSTATPSTATTSDTKSKDGTAQSAAAVKPALTVSTVAPQTRKLPISIAANGNINAWQEASIGAEVNGLRLTQVLVNVGDVVKKGQLLATFTGESVQADVAQAKAALLEAQAHALDAAGNAERARTLQNTGALSTQQINQFITAEKTAAARVEAAQAMLNAQNVRAQNTQVRAADNGIISARNATVGAVVGAGTELFRMIRGGRLEWRAEVTASELSRIKTGQPAKVTAADGSVVNGKVRVVAPSIDAQSRTALVYVDLPVHPSIKAGMYAKGVFTLGEANVLTLPQQAFVLRDGFTYAMRVEPNSKVTQVKLETGRRAEDLVEVRSGAKATDRFVSSGAAFLADGDTVKVVDMPQTAPAAPAPSTTPSTAPAKTQSTGAK